MTDQEIKQLIAEYNATEEAQRGRLAQLFDALNERKGNSRVMFGDSSHVWVNCWHRSGDAKQNLISRQINPVTEFSIAE